MNFYMFAKKTLGSFLLRAVYRCRVAGKENLPSSGGVIVASNHISMRDVVLISAALDRQVFYMAKKELFGFKPLGAFLRKLGAYPVDRSRGTAAIRYSLEMLNNEKAVGIFPQGTRRMKVNPADTKIHSGIGMLQARSGCPVVPVSIKTKNFKVLPFFRKIELTVGKPMTADDFSDCTDENDRYILISQRVFDRILEQLK